MLLNEAYDKVLKTLPPEKKKYKRQRKSKVPYEKPEILAITGLTAHAMSILLESAEMFNVTMANAMLEVANIFEHQQTKLEQGMLLYQRPME